MSPSEPHFSQSYIGDDVVFLTGLSWDFRKTPCQNFLVFSKGSVHPHLHLPSPFEVRPWLSSFSHISHGNSLHAPNLLPKEPGRLWREAASFSPSDNVHLTPIWVTFESQRGIVNNHTHKRGISQDCLSQWRHVVTFPLWFYWLLGVVYNTTKSLLHGILASWHSQMRRHGNPLVGKIIRWVLPAPPVHRPCTNFLILSVSKTCEYNGISLS